MVQTSEAQAVLYNVYHFLIFILKFQYYTLTTCPIEGRKVSKQYFSAKDVTAIVHRSQQQIQKDWERQSGVGSEEEDGHT